ncbi:MAG: hypothetical protein M1837_000361 [Sclerophora amabilis]|nr:MAG: hypothetical protein M1837_000361 [Sclerophora amabilis]
MEGVGEKDRGLKGFLSAGFNWKFLGWTGEVSNLHQSTSVMLDLNSFIGDKSCLWNPGPGIRGRRGANVPEKGCVGQKMKEQKKVQVGWTRMFITNTGKDLGRRMRAGESKSGPDETVTISLVDDLAGGRVRGRSTAMMRWTGVEGTEPASRHESPNQIRSSGGPKNRAWPETRDSAHGRDSPLAGLLDSVRVGDGHKRPDSRDRIEKGGNEDEAGRG